MKSLIVIVFLSLISTALKISLIAGTGALCASDPRKDSWKVYCVKYNVNPDKPTIEQLEFWQDCYAGSQEEEEDLNL